MFAMVFQKFSYAFASVSYACCNCFSCFIRMLQVFHLDVSKVDWDAAHFKVTHLSQSPAAAAWTPCMSVGGSGGIERCSTRGAGSGGRWRQGAQSLRGMRVRQAGGGAGRQRREGTQFPGSGRRRHPAQKRTAATGIRKRASGRPDVGVRLKRVGASSADIYK
jgi:hypothetical protein